MQMLWYVDSAAGGQPLYKRRNYQVYDVIAQQSQFFTVAVPSSTFKPVLQLPYDLQEAKGSMQ